MDDTTEQEYSEKVWSSHLTDEKGNKASSLITPAYKPTIPRFGTLNINDSGNCPLIYSKSWSAALVDIIMNFCRTTKILDDLDYQIPETVFSVISMFYTNDVTKARSYKDYVNALLICKHFVFLKGTERKKLDKNNQKIKKKYKLTKKMVLTTKKIMGALKQFDDEKHSFYFDDDDDDEVALDKPSDFEIYFVDHMENAFNLKKYAYPKDAQYKISQDELDLITAIRDTQKLNKENPVFYKGASSGEVYRSDELKTLCQKMHFKTAKTSIRYHTIIEYRDNMLYAVDYDNVYSYFLFVFRFFTIIIHDKMTGDRHTTRTFQSRSIAAKYRGILEQFALSGL